MERVVDVRVTHLEMLLYEEKRLRELILGNNLQRLQEIKEVIGEIDDVQARRDLFFSLLEVVASPRDTSYDQDLREGALLMLEQFNFKRLSKDGVIGAYLRAEQSLGTNADPEGNVEALARAKELIKNRLDLEDCDFFEKDEVGGSLVSFREVLLRIRDKNGFSNHQLSLRLGYENTYITKILRRGPYRDENFYRRLVKRHIAEPQEVLALLRCPGAPWLLFLEELESGKQERKITGVSLPEEDQIKFKKIFQGLRNRLGLSLSALAKAMGSDPSYIKRLENSERQTPQTEGIYKKLKKVEGVTPPDILALLKCPDGPSWPRFINELRNGSTSSPQGGTI